MHLIHIKFLLYLQKWGWPCRLKFCSDRYQLGRLKFNEYCFESGSNLPSLFHSRSYTDSGIETWILAERWSCHFHVDVQVNIEEAFQIELIVNFTTYLSWFSYAYSKTWLKFWSECIFKKSTRSIQELKRRSQNFKEISFWEDLEVPPIWPTLLPPAIITYFDVKSSLWRFNIILE